MQLVAGPTAGGRGDGFELRDRGHIQADGWVDNHIINTGSFQVQLIQVGRKAFAGKAGIGLIVLAHDNTGAGVAQGRLAVGHRVSAKRHHRVPVAVGRRDGHRNARAGRLALIVRPRPRHFGTKRGFKIPLKQVDRFEEVRIAVNKVLPLVQDSPPVAGRGHYDRLGLVKSRDVGRPRRSAVALANRRNWHLPAQSDIIGIVRRDVFVDISRTWTPIRIAPRP